MNRYPTPEHQNAAEAIVEFFTTIPEIGVEVNTTDIRSQSHSMLG